MQKDVVYDREIRELFSGTPEETKAWLEVHDVPDTTRVGVSTRGGDMLIPVRKYLTLFEDINRR